MHEAYTLGTVLERLPRQIDCIACYSDKLVIGTKEGHLLLYDVKSSDTRVDKPYEVNLEKSNKLFAKKSILQLEVVPEYHILVSITDDVVMLHDLTVFALIGTLDSTKGATCFVLDMKTEALANGELQYDLRLCVVVKRNLQFYYWHSRNFHPFTEKHGKSQLLLPDTPKTILWCGDAICCGFKKDYVLVKIVDGSQCEVFPTGRQMEPLGVVLPERRLALQRDESTIIVDEHGVPTQRVLLTWSYMPYALVYSSPYLLGIMPNCVEVRTIEPRLLIQSGEVSKAKFVCYNRSRQIIYIASPNFIWRLQTTPVVDQIKQLLANKQFELALHLADMTVESVVDKTHRKATIRTLLAFDQFCQHHFELSLQIFIELRTDPSHVIGLYPNLLPDDFRNQLDYPDRLPELEPAVLAEGLHALIAYLIAIRRELHGEGVTEISYTGLVDLQPIRWSCRQMGQIVDTTLLKCYVLTADQSDSLIGSMLRLQDANCHLEESEKILRLHQKFPQLVTLYESKGLHQNALKLLIDMAKREDCSLSGHMPTLCYLQKLGPEKIELIFEYAPFVIKIAPQDALQIFTEDMDEVKALPREDVYNFLERSDKGLVIPYIEHVISEWGDTTMEFHDLYAVQLMQRIAQRSELSTTDGQSVGDKQLAALRKKLTDFLFSSTHYSAERLLAAVPHEGDFFAERALLLGRLGRHDKALAIYVYILRDTKRAVQYCKTTYEAKKEGYRDVYFHLLKLYLEPPTDSTGLAGQGVTGGGQGVTGGGHVVTGGDAGGQQGVRTGLSPFDDEDESSEESLTDLYRAEALRLLKENPLKFNPVQVLSVLPSDVHLTDILSFLETSLAGSAADRWTAEVLKGLLYTQRLQIEEARMYCTRSSFLITEDMTCPVCKHKIGNSAFSRIPSREVVHLCCRDTYAQMLQGGDQPAWESLAPDRGGGGRGRGGSGAYSMPAARR